MTKSQEIDIVNRVKSIQSYRKKIKELNLKIKDLSNEVSGFSNETIRIMEALKKDMDGKTTINIKMDGNYYTLKQDSVAVLIEPLIIDIEV